MPMLIPLIAAGAGVAAGMAAGGLIGGVMIAGAAMSAIGAISGNKRLSQFGAVLGLAGGVAGLASGAWSAAADTVASQAAQEGAVAFEHSAASYGSDALGAGGVTGAAAGGDAALSQANMAAMDPSASAGATAGGMSPNGLDTSDIGIGAVNTGGLQTPPVPGATPPTTVNIVNGGGNQGTAPAIQANGQSATQPGMLQTFKDGAGSIGDSLKSGVKWATANPENARITQAGAGLLSAGFGYVGQQEAVKTKIQMEEAAQARARARLNDSVKGVRVPTYQPLPRG